MPVPPKLTQAAFANQPAPAGLSEEEKGVYEQLAFSIPRFIMPSLWVTRPQTLVALADSPVGLATFMLDHDARSLTLITRSFNGVKEGLSPATMFLTTSRFSG